MEYITKFMVSSFFQKLSSFTIQQDTKHLGKCSNILSIFPPKANKYFSL